MSFVETAPLGERGVVRYLSRAPNIGPATAAKLWTAFGSRAVRVLRETPDKAAGVSFPHLTREKAAEASVYLAEHAAAEDCMIDLAELLDGRGLPRVLSKMAMQTWGNRAARLIRRNPFLLTRFPGVGFLRADALYLDLGRDPAKLTRQTRAVIHTMETDGGGSTWFPTKAVDRSHREKIAGAVGRAADAVRLGKRAGVIATRRDDEGRLWLAGARQAENETFIAEHVAGAQTWSGNWPPTYSPELKLLSEHQCDRVRIACSGSIGALTGSPGTGKTFSAVALAEAVVNRNGLDSIAVAAPTGKAAARITEVMQSREIDLQATTIHRLLGVRSRDDTGWGFLHGAGNPLPHQYVIIDESSMIDVDLMAALLQARSPGTRLLFVGDTNQLPPVGHGRPLYDMIAAGLPCGELKKIRRNSGSIVHACAAMRDNRRFEPDAKLSPRDGRNLRAIPRPNAAATADEIVEVLRRVAVDTNLDPVWDVQVITAINRNSELSRKRLNDRLQRELNTTGKGVPGSPFRVGDKIICLKNHLVPLDGDDLEVDAGDGRTMVCNGEIGKVVDVAEQLTHAIFEAPRRAVKIPRGRAGAQEAGCQFDLAYAITCHKSQGSEWPVVIVALDDGYGSRRIHSREWCYTAISRAKKACFLVGAINEAHRMIGRRVIGERKTFLREVIGDTP